MPVVQDITISDRLVLKPPSDEVTNLKFNLGKSFEHKIPLEAQTPDISPQSKINLKKP